MTTEDIIIGVFCRVDDRLGEEPKDPQAKLQLSEIVTLGMLFALKGKRGRKYYRWRSSNYRHWFPNLPDRMRLFRLFQAYGDMPTSFWRKQEY